MRPAGRDCATCAVKETGCFCTLTAEALTNLQGIGGCMSFKAGERALDEGEAAERVYVLCKGRMKLSASSADGRTLIVRIAGPGEVLGLAETLKGRPHTITAEALELCEAKAIARGEFLAFMERFRDVSRNTALTLAAEYEEAVLSARRLALAGSASRRLASVLLDWGRVDGAPAGEAMEFRMPLTHEELGNMVGLSRETVTRVLTKFRREGIVRQEGERMLLPRPKLLASRYC